MMSFFNTFPALLICFLVQTSFATPTPLWEPLTIKKTDVLKNKKFKDDVPEFSEYYKKVERNKKVENKYDLDHFLEFNIPIENNREVRFWLQYFQTVGKKSYAKWLSRSHRYLPKIKKILKEYGIPEDLAYVAMIESGFSPTAVSSAKAVGPWQFIKETGNRYGLRTTKWLDERRDFDKSTVAAAKYLKHLYSMFGCWHLSVASYNTGENRIQRLINRHQTKDFWTLSRNGRLHEETKDYVPKLIAAMIIAKAPKLYGFRKVKAQQPIHLDHVYIPGGTSLEELDLALGLKRGTIKKLNPEILVTTLPKYVKSHEIKVPAGLKNLTEEYVAHRVLISKNIKDSKPL